MIGGVFAFVLEHWAWFAGGGGLAGAGLAALVPGAGPALLFLRANWKWLLPTVIAVGAVIYAGTQRMNYLGCKADWAEEKRKQQEAIIEQKDRDRLLVNQIVVDQDEANARTDAKAVKTIEVIRHVEVTRACPAAPAMRAAHDGLRGLGFAVQERPTAGVDAEKAGGTQARPR